MGSFPFLLFLFDKNSILLDTFIYFNLQNYITYI